MRGSEAAQIAQLVEQGIENPRVGGSIPSLGTTACVRSTKPGELSAARAHFGRGPRASGSIPSRRARALSWVARRYAPGERARRVEDRALPCRTCTSACVARGPTSRGYPLRTEVDARASEARGHASGERARRVWNRVHASVGRRPAAGACALFVEAAALPAGVLKHASSDRSPALGSFGGASRSPVRSISHRPGVKNRRRIRSASPPLTKHFTVSSGKKTDFGPFRLTNL